MTAPRFLIENPRCVFIHIPKTGGTSIKSIFGYTWQSAGVPGPDIVPAAWEKCFKFTFVRNPYDRLVSSWKYFRGLSARPRGTALVISPWNFPIAIPCGGGASQCGQYDTVTEKNIFSFADFVQIVTSRTDLQLPQGNVYHHTMPQLHPRNYLEYADFIGRFENLQEDFDKICDRLNIPKQKLPHHNKTNHKHYSSYYNKKIKMMADQYYEEDLQKLGYHFSKEWL